jgi:hypothetical protein
MYPCCVPITDNLICIIIIIFCFFVTNTGERFYEVMFYFSSYVLRKVMVRDHSHGNWL